VYDPTNPPDPRQPAPNPEAPTVTVAPANTLTTAQVVEQMMSAEAAGKLGKIKPLEAAAEKEIETGIEEQPEDVDGEAEFVELKPEKPEPAAEPESDEPTARDVLKQLDTTLKDIVAAQAKQAAETAKPEAAPEEEIPADIRMLLESDEESLQAAGQVALARHQRTEKRLAALEEQTRNTQLAAEIVAIDKEITAVSASCDPPLTETEKKAVVDRLAAEDESGYTLAKSLNFADGVRLVLPGRLKAATKGARTPAPSKNGAAAAVDVDGRPVVKVGIQRPETATVLDRGGAAGATPTPSKPSARETMEQAVSRVGKNLNLTR
jgi:hypothetical protein